MSYSMTHLLIAEEYLKKQKKSQEEQALFLLASIAPDAVHMNSDYTPHQKELSHFFVPGIAWGTVHKKEEVDAWYAYFKKCYEEHANKEMTVHERAFFEGYIQHILVDHFNCKYVYGPNLDSFGPDVETFRTEYRKQSIECDNYLYQQAENRDELFDLMRKGCELLEKENIIVNILPDCPISTEAVRAFLERKEPNYQKAGKAVWQETDMVRPDNSVAYIHLVAAECEKLLFLLEPYDWTLYKL